MEAESGCFLSTKDILPSNSWCCRAPGRDGCRNLAQVVLKDVGFVSWVDTWPRKKTNHGIFCESIKRVKWEINRYVDTIFVFENSLHIHRTCIHHRYIEIRNSSCRPFNKVPPWLKKTLVRYAVGYMLHFILGHFVPVEERVVSFGNMPNGRCQNRT